MSHILQLSCKFGTLTFDFSLLGLWFQIFLNFYCETRRKILRVCCIASETAYVGDRERKLWMEEGCPSSSCHDAGADGTGWLAPGFMERSAALLTLLVVAHGLATSETFDMMIVVAAAKCCSQWPLLTTWHAI